MPTDILRERSRVAKGGKPVPGAGMQGERVIVLTAGLVRVRARLAATASADLVWAALPLYGKAEPWGDAIHFEIPVFSGRDRTARLQARLGDICLWCEERRIIVAYGPTPISAANEIRMPAPVNVIASALDDVAVLRGARVGEKIAIERWQG